MGAELLFAFGLEYLLERSRGRTWQVGLGPVPIVFSTNLFIRFEPWDFDGVIPIVALAILSKTFLRSEGRHIFNPSALGLAVFGFYAYLAPWHAPYVDIAHQLGLAPNMTEVIFLLGLIVALRLPILPITVAAAVGLQAWNHLPGSSITPWPYWPPMFLVFMFLATDPMTIPRTTGGRILYGFFVGFGTGLGSNLLVSTLGTDYFGKVFAVPVCNLLVPWMDRVAGRGLWGPQVDVRWRRVQVAAWCCLFALTFHEFRKAGAFNRELQTANRTPLLVHHTLGERVECRDNPIFCRRFTLWQELQAWLGSTSDPVPR